jgi:hypothetical protein
MNDNSFHIRIRGDDDVPLISEALHRLSWFEAVEEGPGLRPARESENGYRESSFVSTPKAIIAHFIQ